MELSAPINPITMEDNPALANQPWHVRGKINITNLDHNGKYDYITYESTYLHENDIL